MTVETASYVNGLNSSYPASGDNPQEGDDHMRLIKAVLLATFPNLAGAVTPTHTQLNYVAGVTSAIQTQLDAKAATTAVGWTLLSAQSASASATIDFTSSIDSTYDEYILEIINAVPSTGSTVPWLRTSADAGATWASTSGDYQWTLINSAGTSATVTNGGSNATSLIIGPAISGTASLGGFNATVRIFDPAGTAIQKAICCNGSAFDGGSFSGVNVCSASGRRLATAAVNALRFMFSSGNIASGKFKLYGVKK